MSGRPGRAVSLVATGWSVHLPGVDLAAGLAAAGIAAGPWAATPAVPAHRAAELLGRKGMLYKDPATRLALCAVHRALGLPAGARPATVGVDPRTAVVVCGNLGNVETVAKVARTVATEGGRGVSVLDAPNVSSNVVASTVALWFGYGGPNLAVCSGSTAGLDGLRLAGVLLAADRADRVVLVGTEPDDDVATALHAADLTGLPLRAAAAAVVVERPYPRPGNPPGPALVLPDAQLGEPAGIVIGPGGVDPVVHWGDGYGAQGVASLAIALYLSIDDGLGPVGVRLDGVDGSRTALVRAADQVDGR